MEGGSTSRVEATETEPVGLAGLRRQFQAWRARKGSGESIPQNLWQGTAAFNEVRPHSALGNLTPAEFKRRPSTTNPDRAISEV